MVGAGGSRAFGDWLRARMGTRSYGQVAVYVGVSTSTVSRWVTGQAAPSYANQLRLAEYLDAPLREFAAFFPHMRYPADAVPPPDDADLRAAVIRLVEAYERGERPIARYAHAGRPPGLPDQGDATELERAVVAAEGYEQIFSVKVRTGALADRRRPVLVGDTIWLDPLRPTAPGRAVAVVQDERLLLRTVGPDGATLHSAEPADPPLRLDAVERVVGVMTLFQVTEP